MENIKNIFDLHAYDLYIHKKPRQVVEDVPQQTIEHEPEPEPYEEETQFQDNIRGKAFTPRGKHVNLVRRHIDKSTKNSAYPYKTVSFTILKYKNIRSVFKRKFIERNRTI